MKILLVQLASMGDCLFVSSIAKQIKKDYPNCHLSWLIGDMYKEIIQNNPFVDEIIPVFIPNFQWRIYIDKMVETYKNDYDKIIITDFYKDNYKNFYGTTRASFFRNYPNKIEDINPQIFLTEKEVKNVSDFVKKHSIKEKFSIFVEYAPESGQSKFNLEFALQVANKIVCKNKNVKFIFSSKNKLNLKNKNFVDANCLSFRENAELMKYCNLFLGCSSGLTWLNLSNWAKTLPMIIVVNKGENYCKSFISASVEEDFEYFNLSTENLIEFENMDLEQLENCLSLVIEKDFSEAKRKYFNKKIGKNNCNELELSQKSNEYFRANEQEILHAKKQVIKENRYLLYLFFSIIGTARTKKHFKRRFLECKYLYK